MTVPACHCVCRANPASDLSLSSSNLFHYLHKRHPKRMPLLKSLCACAQSCDTQRDTCATEEQQTQWIKTETFLCRALQCAVMDFFVFPIAVWSSHLCNRFFFSSKMSSSWRLKSWFESRPRGVLSSVHSWRLPAQIENHQEAEIHPEAEVLTCSFPANV